MQVKGEHEFKVNREKLWDYLMDPEVLAKITPGVTKLEQLGDDKYKSVSDIKIGPVKGSFSGKLHVIDKEHPNSFAIKMEQLSKIGNAHVRVDMTLTELETEGSSLAFDGKAKLSGVIARTGQRVLSGVANAITKEVFASLEEHIEQDSASSEESSSTEQQSAPVAKEMQAKAEALDTKSASNGSATAKTTTASHTNPESKQNLKVDIESNTKTLKEENSGLLASIANFFKGLFGG